MLSNVDIVEEKIRKYKPSAVCVVGKGIWDIIYERKNFGKKVGKEFKFGWQELRMGVDDGWNGAMTFVTPSTSGRVAAYSREFQEILWKELGDWVVEERELRSKEVKNESERVKVESEEESKETNTGVEAENKNIKVED
jgi:thymine-DNA glycosylase